MQIVLDSLVWLQNEKRILLFAFVIMPSHLHLILRPEGKTIGEVVQDFGSYAAHIILHELCEDKRDDLLKFFHEQRRIVGIDIAFGRIFKPRIFIHLNFYFRRSNIFITTLYPKIGNWLMTGQPINMQAPVFMKKEFLQSLQLLILTSG